MEGSPRARQRLRNELVPRHLLSLAPSVGVARTRAEEALPAAAVIALDEANENENELELELELELVQWLARQRVPVLAVIPDDSYRRRLLGAGAALALARPAEQDEAGQLRHAARVAAWLDAVVLGVHDSVRPRASDFPARPLITSSRAPRISKAAPPPATKTPPANKTALPTNKAPPPYPSKAPRHPSKTPRHPSKTPRHPSTAPRNPNNAPRHPSRSPLPHVISSATGAAHSAAGATHSAAGTAHSAAGATHSAAGATHSATGATHSAAGITHSAAGTAHSAAGTTHSAAGTTHSAAGTTHSASRASKTAPPQALSRSRHPAHNGYAIDLPISRPVNFEPASTVICIGISTGGPEALETLFRQFPATMPPIVIVQHMPPGFTANLARRLDNISAMTVHEASDEETLHTGLALLAPGGIHLRLRRQGFHVVTELLDTPPVGRHRPSVNVLFESAAEVVGSLGVGVVMTGMGDDGTLGILAMKARGALTIAQDAHGCTVFGMPQRAIASGAIDYIVPLDSMAQRLVELTHPAEFAPPV